MDNSNKQLLEACEIGDLDKVKYLVSKGADTHANNEYALRLSAGYGHLEVVKYLVSKGADVHSNDGWILRWSAYCGYLEVIKYLVSQGMDIHAYNEYALRNSARNGYLKIVKFLIIKGANYKKIWKEIPEEIQIQIIRWIISIKRIQRWILKIFSKPYYKDGTVGFLARSGWDKCKILF